MNISLLGTGMIGSAIAEALLQAGYHVTVYNRTTSRAKPLEEKGAVIAETAAQAVEVSDIVFLTMIDLNAIREILFSVDCKKILAGKNFLNIATVSAKEIQAVADELYSLGATLSELAVKSDAVQVRQNEMYALLACELSLKDFWLQLLKPLGETVYAGNVGNAATASALAIMEGTFNNLYLAYALAFSIKTNLPMEIIEKAIETTNPGAKNILNELINRNYTNGMATLDGFRDTAVIAVDTLKSVGIPVKVFEEIIALYDSAKEKGYGTQAETALTEALL